MVAVTKYYKELDKLRLEHQLLEAEINCLMNDKVVNKIYIMGLKKKKLQLKTSIMLLNDLIHNNLTA